MVNKNKVERNVAIYCFTEVNKTKKITKVLKFSMVGLKSNVFTCNSGRLWIANKKKSCCKTAQKLGFKLYFYKSVENLNHFILSIYYFDQF
jgi:hypothetical protein